MKKQVEGNNEFYYNKDIPAPALLGLIISKLPGKIIEISKNVIKKVNKLIYKK